MPAATLYPNGAVIACGGNKSPIGGKRGQICGFSQSSLLRLRKFLMSVVTDAICGQWIGYTLTLQQCPESGADWKALLDAWWRDVKRVAILDMGLTEWQLRQVPHAHGILVVPEGVDAHRFADVAKAAWLRVARRYGAESHAQHMFVSADPSAWLKYIAAHGSRGLKHYQRSPDNMPESWKGASSGKMWWTHGDWPTAEPVNVVVSWAYFIEAKRAILSAQQADAVREGNAHRVEYLRSRLEAVNAGVADEEYLPVTLLGTPSELLQILRRYGASGSSLPRWMEGALAGANLMRTQDGTARVVG